MIINQATTQESQVNALPEPSAALAGKIVQLVGNPPVTYTTEGITIDGDEVPDISSEDYVAFVVDNVSGTCSPTDIGITSARKSEDSDEWQMNFQDEPDNVLVTVQKTTAQLAAAGFTDLSGITSFDVYGSITQTSSNYTKGYFYECTNEATYTLTNLTYTPYPQYLDMSLTVESNAGFIRLVTDYIGVSDPTQVSYITARNNEDGFFVFTAYDNEDNQLAQSSGVSEGDLESQYSIIVESGDGFEEGQGWDWYPTITSSGGAYRWKQTNTQLGIPTPPTSDGVYTLMAYVADGVATLRWVE